MSSVYTKTGPKYLSYLSPVEYKFVLHSDPDLGYGLRAANAFNEDYRTAFEQRLEVTSRAVNRWLRWRFDEIDPATLDDCLQAGLIGLWQAYQEDPRLLESEHQGVWNQRAKYHAHKAMYRKYLSYSRYRKTLRGLVWRTVSHTFTDLETEECQGMLAELIGDDCDSIARVEDALDLELAIEAALKKLKPDDREDALKFIQLRLIGFNREEIAETLHKSYGRVGRIEQLLKKLLCEALGKHYAPRGSHTRSRASEGEKARILQLHAEGWTYAQIAARTGRSGSYVHKLVNGIKKPSAQAIAEMRAMRESGMTNKQIAYAIGKSDSYVHNALC